MQRPAQRDQCDERDRRAPRARRLHRVLVRAAAVPALLIATGCSSDSGSDDAGDASKSGSGASASASPSPTVRAAAYDALPESCAVLSKKTLSQLVPKGTKSGKEGSSGDTATRASCSWSSLDNNGVKGSQFRWLNVALLRFESDTSRGSGEEQAADYYAQQIQDAEATKNAKNTRSTALTGTGDQATTVTYDLKKEEGAFKQQTVVARVENVVVTLDYNGAGLAGEKTPKAATLTKLAEKAAREVVASVTTANDKGKDKGTTASPSPSDSASKSGSPSASKSGSRSSSGSKKS